MKSRLVLTGLKQVGFHFSTAWWATGHRLLTRVLAAVAMLGALSAWAQSPFEVGANTPVYFSDKLNPLVWEDQGGQATLAQVRQRLQDFKPIDTVTQIKPGSHYWVVQKLSNRLGENRDFIVDASRTDRRLNWLRYQHYAVYPDGSVKELNGPFSDNVPVLMRDIDPQVFTMDTSLSRSPVFTLHRHSEVQLFSRLKSNSTLPASSLALNFYDRSTFLELRQYGLYLEGVVAGLLLPLIIINWYTLAYKRDPVSLIYAIWLVVGFLQIVTMPIQDGQRLFEFVFPLYHSTIGTMPAQMFWFDLFTYGQTTLFALFGCAFLNTYKNFPRLHRLTLFFITFEALHFVLGHFWEHEIRPSLFALPSFVVGVIVYLGFPVAAITRYRQGLRSAQFAATSSVIYAAIWLIWALDGFGLSVLDHLPSTGLGLLLKSDHVLLVFMVCLPAIVTTFSMQSRTRGIEKKLRTTLTEQKEAVEQQNKILEATVQERTRELQDQHRALNAAHELLTDSVQYASRLQRGQLPRAIRLDQRFASLATLWEPRDTIGGDLWWISSSQHSGPFVLAVADCTGHGVPGAMLSLLVSNSLERIYATSTDENPASALLSLDHYVRAGLNQDGADSTSDDGCDAVILRIDRQRQRIEFAGAKMGLFHVNAQGQVTRHTGARCSLGYVERIGESNRPELNTITYSRGDVFAIVTDGITDQIGRHERGRSAYGYRRLAAVLQQHAHASAGDIVQKMQEDFSQWQGQEARRDDVTAVVFKL